MRRTGSREAGFTLVELMVVVLIIGILIAIALPTYLGARARAADRAAESDIRTGLTAGLSYFVGSSQSTYTGFDAVSAALAEPALHWVTATQPNIGDLDIQVASGQNLLLVGKSRSQTFFCLAQVSGSPVTSRGQNVDFTQIDTIAECTGGW